MPAVGESLLAVDATTENNYVDKLAEKLGEKWPAISKAQAVCLQKKATLGQIITDLRPSPDTSVVAFGSLARGEWTTSSDVDWTLIIDGQSNVDHFDAAKSVENAIADGKHKAPGATRTFGTIVGSHELVHQIGGLEDTNQNMTRRVLMLLESVSLSGDTVHDRVIRTILQRYITSDLPASGTTTFHVPMFLLNDIVRFWRTMAVDYASKKREQAKAGWALRNIKLRMSRKLVFTKGMLACFLCDEKFARKLPLDAPNEETASIDLLQRCYGLMRLPAIEILAWALLEFAKPETARLTMNAYDQFLGMLSNEDLRTKLKELSFEDKNDEAFKSQRRNSNDFQSGLEQLFFNSNEELKKTHPEKWSFLMRKIGFSTGALAKGDFRQGISLQEDHTNAIELSSLRESELDALIEAIPTLNLCKFEYVSFHAPSHRVNLSEQELVDRLKIVADDACSIRNIIVHPDLIQSPSLWKPLGDCIVLENMGPTQIGRAYHKRAATVFRQLARRSILF